MKNLLCPIIILLSFCSINNSYSQIKVIDTKVCIGCLDPANAKLKSQGTSQLEFALDALEGNADFTYQINGLTKAQIKYLINTPGITYNMDATSTGTGGLPQTRSALFLDAISLEVGINETDPKATLDVKGDINYSGSLTNMSDRRLKENIQTFKLGLNTILALEPITYNYNGLADLKTENMHIGITAQNLQQVAPTLVKKWEHKSYATQTQEEIDEELPQQIESTEQYLSINEGAIKYVLINAIKEQQNTIDNQQKLINRQAEKIKELEDKVNILLTKSQ